MRPSDTSFFHLSLRSLKLASIGLLLLAFILTTGQARDEWIELPTQLKLERTILPSVEFHQTKLSDVLELFRQEAKRLYPESDPSRRYINIVFSPQATPAMEARITLTMHQIPMSEALKYVASQAGLKVKMELRAVSLVPMTEDTDPLVTATFRVAPRIFGNRSGIDRGSNVLNQDVTSAQ